MMGSTVAICSIWCHQRLKSNDQIDSRRDVPTLRLLEAPILSLQLLAGLG